MRKLVAIDKTRTLSWNWRCSHSKRTWEMASLTHEEKMQAGVQAENKSQ